MLEFYDRNRIRITCFTERIRGSGSKTKLSDVEFLLVDLLIFHSSLKFLFKNFAIFQDIRRFKFVIPDNKKTNYTWNHDDPSVPAGTEVYLFNHLGLILIYHLSRNIFSFLVQCFDFVGNGNFVFLSFLYRFVFCIGLKSLNE